MNVCMWLITNWRGQCCHRWQHCCYMGSFRCFVARDVSSLIRDIFLIDDGITSSSRNTRAEDGARGWMWANDLVIDAPAWSVTHDTSDGRRLQSRRPAHQTSSAVRGNNRDGNKILSSSSSSYRCCDSRQGHWVKVVCALPVNCPTRLQSRVHQRRQPITDHKQKHKQWLLENIEGGKRLEGQCRNLLCCVNQKQQVSLNCKKLIASR